MVYLLFRFAANDVFQRIKSNPLIGLLLNISVTCTVNYVHVVSELLAGEVLDSLSVLYFSLGAFHCEFDR